MQTVVEYAIMALSLIVALRTLRPLGDYLSDQATRWTALGLLVFVLGGFLGDTVQLNGIAVVKLFYVIPFVIGLLAPLWARVTKPAMAISLSAAFAGTLLWLWLAVSNLVANATRLDSASLLLRLTPGIIWLAILVVRERTPLDRQMLTTVATFSVAVCGALVPFAGSQWRPCDDTKCGVFDGMLLGLYTSENYFAQQIAVVAILHLVAFGVKRTLYLVPLISLWLLATESRTAQYSVVAACLVLVTFTVLRQVANVFLNWRVHGLASRAFLTSLPLLFVSVALYLALTAERSDFSGRGSVWVQVMSALKGSEIAGLGLDSWEVYQETGLIPAQLFAHSIYIFLAFSGGAIALVVFVIFVRQCLIGALQRDGNIRSITALAVPLLMIGLQEVVWNPSSIDGTSWIPLILLVASASTRRAPRDLKSSLRTKNLHAESRRVSL